MKENIGDKSPPKPRADMYGLPNKTHGSCWLVVFGGTDRVPTPTG